MMDRIVNTAINSMINYFEGDVKRINHALKVHSFAKLIASDERLDNETNLIIELAAIYHDVGIKNSEKYYNSTSGFNQEVEGEIVVRELMKEIINDDKIVERVCWLVGHHHSYGIEGGKDYDILIESDFLVNIYEDKINIESIREIANKYFKSKSSIKLLKTMYNVK